MRLVDSAFVIGRRDFVATVWSKSFILFLLAPLVIFGFSMLAGMSAGRADRAASQPVVAVAADASTLQALEQARARLVAGTSEMAFPTLRRVPVPERREDVAGYLVAREGEEAYSAVFSGTIDAPVLTGPPTVDAGVAGRIALLVEDARRASALDTAGVTVPPPALNRVVTAEAAGDLRLMRRGLAQGAQLLIFMITLMLATLLLSNLVEEKSNKVIEILAASAPLDAVFIGKLGAMLCISLVGLVVWGVALGVGYLFIQKLQAFMALPAVVPAVGWPAFIALLLLYYATNYMLLGALFLGIGGQASNIREIQTLSMPVTFLQLGVLLLAMNAIGQEGGALMWTAYVVPFSSPLSMVALAAQSETLWPHFAALAWQALWVVLIIRLSAALFRKTVLKSGARQGFWKELKAWVR
jgi:ABC-2 type transport system permease protein